MADLTRAPAFLSATSLSGSLELKWTPFAAAEVHVWVLLADPHQASAADAAPEALLRQLIRVPVEAAAGKAVVYVPVDRPLGILLMARDEHGQIVASPTPEVRSGAPVARVAPTRPPAEASEPARTEPPRRIGWPQRQPLVFARGQDPLPDLASLARRVAERVGVRAVEPPAPPASRPAEPSAAGPHCFGARQRWTLTRLGFPPAPAGRERAFVVRQTFLDQALIASWEAAPPPDAVALPAEADGLVDATTPEDAMAFYAVLEGPAPWRAISVTLLNPPFDAAKRPFVLGDARSRLGPLLEQAAASDEHASLVAAAMHGLVPLGEVER